MSRDIRYALRLLRRTPLFTLTAIGTLGIAVAVNAAVFSIVDATLLKPLPYPRPRVEHLFTATLEALARGGVERAGVSLGLPYERLLNLGFRRLDGRGAGERGMTSATYVAGDFFGTLRLPVLQGRTFTAADTATAPAVAIVNRAFADQYFKGDAALGRRIAFAGRDRDIVGVVGGVQLRPGWGDHGPLAPMPLAYVPLSQLNDATLRLVHGWFSPAFVVRSGGDMRAAAESLQRALKAADAGLPFARIRTIAEVEAETLRVQRVMSTIIGLLALAAALLAAAGVYGLIAASVSDRARELGIRIALGATRCQAIVNVARPGLGLSVAGVLIGCVGAYALSGGVRHLVWGISVTDPATFAAVGGATLALAAGASLWPALRVMHLDPAQTLRRD